MPKLMPEEAGGGDEDDVEAKPEKAPAPRSSGMDRSVHFIPLVIVLCFILLFLCSHDPSPSGTCNESRVCVLTSPCSFSCVFMLISSSLLTVYCFLSADMTSFGQKAGSQNAKSL
jgi:hypothetical protein